MISNRFQDDDNTINQSCSITLENSPIDRVTKAAVKKLIKSIKTKRIPEYDLITVEVLKEIPKICSKFLLYLVINFSMCITKIPQVCPSVLLNNALLS